MKLMKTVWTTAVASTLVVASIGVQAQTKKELVQKLLVLQQPSLDSTARSLTENPARQLVAAAQPIIAQGVPADKREATARQVDAEIRKYIDAADPIVQASTRKLSQSVLTPMFEEKFTEEELRQLVTIIESPVLKKYQGMLPEFSRTLVEKVIADARPQVDPKLQTTQNNVRKILDTATGGKLSGAANNAAAPATKAKTGK